MAIFRVIKDSSNPYVMSNKGFVYDSRLSAKATGIMCYLLSRPDNWKIYETEIANHFSDKRHSIRTGIKELIDIGYIERRQDRAESGQFRGYEYDVYETSNRVRFSDNGKSDIGETDTINNDLTDIELSNKLKSIYSVPETGNGDAHKPFYNLKTMIFGNPETSNLIFSYLSIFEQTQNTPHPRVTIEQASEIGRCIENIIYCDVEHSQWIDAVKEHFATLPDSNNGNIIAFLKASMRYFEVDTSCNYA